jgi:hypothetical protein
MAHYNAARIAEVKAESERRAKVLFNKAMLGEITCTEAWHSLPAPAPIVDARGYGSETHYTLQYQFLDVAEVKRIRIGMDQEWSNAMAARDTIQVAVPRLHESKIQEMTTAVETTRKTADLYAIGAAQRKTQIDELRRQLAEYENAYETHMQEFESVKRATELAESTHWDYTSKSAAMMRVAKEEGEVVLNRLGKYRDDNVARQKAETEEWNRLWEEHDAELFRARGQEAQDRVEIQVRKERAARIQEIARRRLEEDRELEAGVEVAAAMRDLRRG